jgi:hypothetical protein
MIKCDLICVSVDLGYAGNPVLYGEYLAGAAYF